MVLLASAHVHRHHFRTIFARKTTPLFMKTLATLLSLAALATSASAQISLSGGNPVYTQDFNTLDTNATNSSNLPNGWVIAEAGTGGAANGQYRSGNGSANAGDTYSFGATQNTDRALGSLASNSVRPFFGASFTNNTGVPLVNVQVTYRAEQWRAGDTAVKTDTLMFYYSTTATAIDTSTSGWTAVPALLTLSTNSAATGTSGNATDGNTVFTNMNATLTFPTPIPNGSTLRVKWMDVNILGSDDGIAIDDLTMRFFTGQVSVGEIVASATLPVTVLGRATSGNTTVGFTAETAGAGTARIFDLTGREVYRQNVQATAGANRVALMPAGLAAGAYILRLEVGGKTGAVKFGLE